MFLGHINLRFFSFKKVTLICKLKIKKLKNNYKYELITGYENLNSKVVKKILIASKIALQIYYEMI